MNKVLKQSFTLIELLVVIAIIGILSGLIVVSMSGVTQKANIAKAQVFSNSLRNSLMMNIVSEWKFEDNVNDSWGSNNGTVMGTPVYESSANCIFGRCFSFSGDDYITLTSKTYNLSAGLTISFWSKKNLEHNGIIIGSTATTSYRRLIFLTDSTLYLETDTNSDSCSGDVKHDTNWHYYVITTSGLVATFYEDSVNRTVNSSITNGNITLDAIGYGYYYNGLLDELRIFDAKMSSSQIKEQYYIGLNNLLISDQIDSDEYVKRINSIAINE
jgi:prepilin-type N-terminal cleavage/methylation domain-containing protein